jgi:hypothetical protein
VFGQGSLNRPVFDVSPSHDQGIGEQFLAGKELTTITLGKATVRVLHLDRRIHLRVRASVVWIEAVPVAQVLHRSSLRSPGRPGRTLKVSQFDQTVVLAASMIGNSKEARRTLQTDPASSYK